MRVLLVDDELDTRESLAELLVEWGYDVTAAEGVDGGLKWIENRAFDVVLSDLVMPGGGGLALLRGMREGGYDAPVLLLSGRGTIDAAVAAIREGALDFIEKPVEAQRLRMSLERAVEETRMRHELNSLHKRLRDKAGQFIGQSHAMKEVFALIDKVAPSKASVVITGASGTGKEIVARAIHNLSPRRDRPFIAINCSAIAPTLMESEIFGHERGAFTGADQRRLGCFELADGGTLFLDEVGEVPAELQAKFLRVLEEEKVRRLGGKAETSVDVRVLAATNRDLKARIKSGDFREDLYFRLNVFQVHLPPLKDRPEDIPTLVAHFIARFAAEAGKRVHGASPEALRLLSDYAWPGNIRELRNSIERAVLLCEGQEITADDLPSDVVRATDQAALNLPLGLALSDVTRAYIEAMLVREGGNKSRAAQALGISEKTLYNKLQRYAADDRRSTPADVSSG